jgi:hypothetical protein
MISLSLILVIIFYNVLGVDNSNTQPLNLCELHGTVFIADDPELANFFIYEEDSEAFADFLIYETDNALFATDPGIWYFTEKKGFADFSVYFVESKGSADFTVYFTSFESFAGCNN